MLVKEIKVEEGIGIWGNTECAQCGACCYQLHKYYHQIDEKEPDTCKNFRIENGKAYCSAHEDKRLHLCENFFCGNVEFIPRFRMNGDEKLRTIAFKIGTTLKSFTIPKLLPRKEPIEIRVLS